MKSYDPGQSNPKHERTGNIAGTLWIGRPPVTNKRRGNDPVGEDYDPRRGPCKFRRISFANDRYHEHGGQYESDGTKSSRRDGPAAQPEWQASNSCHGYYS